LSLIPIGRREELFERGRGTDPVSRLGSLRTGYVNTTRILLNERCNDLWFAREELLAALESKLMKLSLALFISLAFTGLVACDSKEKQHERELAH
jgi:hypothetical protein